MLLAEEVVKNAITFLGLSERFWISVLVLALFLTAIFTSSYNEDKTKGL